MPAPWRCSWSSTWGRYATPYPQDFDTTFIMRKRGERRTPNVFVARAKRKTKNCKKDTARTILHRNPCHLASQAARLRADSRRGSAYIARRPPLQSASLPTLIFELRHFVAQFKRPAFLKPVAIYNCHGNKSGIRNRLCEFPAGPSESNAFFHHSSCVFVL